MIQIDLTVVYDGKLYSTNVITSRDTSEEEVMQLAISQVEQQWKE
ncbi:BA3454 family stress response protein [Oceanobacillus saliphilus]|nr:BA3454 family stress response protein [Oceanobacillus saliphilus]